MKDSNEQNPPPERSSLSLAGEWGLTIATSTTLCALFCYWLGGRFHNQAVTICMVLFGIAGGFGLAVARMLKVTEQYVRSGASASAPTPALGTASPSQPGKSAIVEEKSLPSGAPEPDYYTSEEELDNWDANN